MNPDVLVKVVEQSHTWWEVIPAVMGGIIGALAGGLPALWLANRASREMDKREQKVRDEQDLARAFRLFAVLQTIVNNFFSTRMQLEEMLASPPKDGDKTPYQRRIRGLVGFTDEQSMHFAADDLALLAAAGANEYLVELTLIDRRHSALMSALTSYAQYRDRFTQFMLEVGQHEIQESGEIGTLVPDKLAPKVMIREYQLETIIRPAVEMMDEDTPKIIAAAENFGPIMKRYFGTKGPLLGFDMADLRKTYLEKDVGSGQRSG